MDSGPDPVKVWSLGLLVASMAALGALVAWSSSIHGEWGDQDHGTVAGGYLLVLAAIVCGAGGIRVARRGAWQLRVVAWIVGGVCVLVALLFALGIDFSRHDKPGF